jgi:hypothetical protein
MESTRKDELYHGTNRANFLNCVVIDLNRENEKEGKEMAKQMVQLGMHEILMNNFIANFEYRLAEMQYIKRLSELDGITDDWSTLRLCEELQEKGADEVCKWYAGFDFNWNEKRYYTPEEEALFSARMKEAMKDFVPKFLKK